MLTVVYYSRTGNVRRFIDKTGLPAIELRPELIVSEPFILVTPTTGFGQVPGAAAEFLRLNHRGLRAVAASGNRNWGPSYAGAADVISEQYGVPIALKFELAGTAADVRKFREMCADGSGPIG